MNWVSLAAGLLATTALVFSQPVSGTIRLCGQKNLRPQVERWAAAFHAANPRVDVRIDMRGNASAIGLLYTGAADAALLGRDIWPTELDAYDQVFGRKPYQVPVMTERAGETLAVFVHPSNPLTNITAVQIDGLFGSDHLRCDRNLRTWGELGLTGDWASQPVHPYAFGPDTRDYMFFLAERLMGGSRKWSDALREFSSSKEIIGAVAKDRFGIAIATASSGGNRMKTLALDGVLPGGARYPLSRSISLLADRAPGQPLNPTLREFLRFILGKEGQSAVTGFLPLRADMAASSVRSIE